MLTFYRPITISLAAGAVTLAACATGEFATQREIDRCVDFVGVQDSAFRLKQTLQSDGVNVVIQEFRDLTPTERAALETCIENQVNARLLGRAVPVDNPVNAPPAKPGQLALPTQYPLLPGDIELWDQMTLEEQQRAMKFLANGSTIRASLEDD